MTKLDQYLLHKIIGAHSKVLIQILYLETSSIHLDFILKSRRINYIHTILVRNESEQPKKVNLAQKLHPINVDWDSMVKKEL